MVDQKLYNLSKKILTIIYGKGFVNKIIKHYGKDSLLHKAVEVAPYAYRSVFKTGFNAYISREIMYDKAQDIKLNLNSFISLLLRYYSTVVSSTTSHSDYSINVYDSLVVAKDASPKLKKWKTRSKKYKQGIIWTDKVNHKSSLKLLSKVRTKFNNQIKKYQNVQLVLSKNENPHHKSKYNHIYSHPHTHSLLLIIGNPLHVANHLRNLLNKDFKHYFGYKPVEATVNPFIDKPTKSDVSFNNHKNNNQSYSDVDRFVDYLSEDYRLQIKDSDNFAFDKHLTNSQKRLTYEADLDSGKSTRVINAVSSRKVSKLRQKSFLKNKQIQTKLALKSIKTEPIKKTLKSFNIQGLLTKQMINKTGSKANFGANYRTEMVDLLTKDNKPMILTYINFFSPVVSHPLLRNLSATNLLMISRHKPT